MKKDNKINKKYEDLDEFYYHEALDRTHIIANMVEDVLVDHPVYKKHLHLKKQVKKAQRILCDLYQEIGSLSITEFQDLHKNKIK